MVEMQETDFLNASCSDGGFLQSEAWRRFQEVEGHRTVHVEQNNLWANVIEHTLPLVGKYWYVPRGPIFRNGKVELQDLVRQAREQGVSWLRIEPDNEEVLHNVRQQMGASVRKAPHDMQPREILILDIQSGEAELLKGMKSKTRYNIRLAERKEVHIVVTHEKRYREAFFDLIAVTAARDGIVAHPRAHYEAMLNTLPETMWSLFVAEHEGTIIAANLVIFFGDYATYLHGASGNEHRERMAPYLLQWEAIREAKKRGCRWYDFGGVSQEKGSWAGITRFKSGFAPKAMPVVFPGAYDIVLHPVKYLVYRGLSGLRGHLK